MQRPQISDAEVDKLATYFFDAKEAPKVVVFGIRGYYEDSIGKKGVNDINVYDDAWLVYENGTLIKTFAANTDPSKARADLAMIPPGVYTFYKGMHRGRIKAFRAYPEGVKWRCVRQNKKGQWLESWCSHINLHDGGKFDTWSMGCQTSLQFVEFRDLVYKLMDRHNEKILTYVLLTENTMDQILNGDVARNLSSSNIQPKPLSTLVVTAPKKSDSLFGQDLSFPISDEEVSEVLDGIDKMQEKAFNSIKEPTDTTEKIKTNGDIIKDITMSKEKPSWTTFINANMLQVLGGSGIVAGIYEALVNPENIVLIGILLAIGAIVVYFALSHWRSSSKDKLELNLKKLDLMADPNKHNVDLK